MNNEMINTNENNNNENDRMKIFEAGLAKLQENDAILSQMFSTFVGGITEQVENKVKKQVKEEMISSKTEITNNVLETVSGQIDDKVENKVIEVVNQRGLNRQETIRLNKVRNHRIYELLGSGIEYKIFVKFYQSAIMKSFRKEFDVSSYSDISPAKLEEAINFIKSFNVSEEYRNWCISKLHESYKNNFDNYNNEAQRREMCESYEKYFGIKS